MAKKPKVAEPSCSLSKFVTTILAEGDETTKFQLRKQELVGLMNYVMAECIAKLQCLAAAEEEEECTDRHEPSDPTDDDNNDPNVDDDEPNEPNEANNQPP